MAKKRAGKRAKRLSADRNDMGGVQMVLAVALLLYILVFAVTALFPSILGGNVRADGIHVSVLSVLLLSVPLFVLAGVILAIMTLMESVWSTERVLSVLQIASVVVGLLGTLTIVAISDPDVRESTYAVAGALFFALGMSSGLTGVLAGVVVWGGGRGKRVRE